MTVIKKALFLGIATMPLAAWTAGAQPPFSAPTPAADATQAPIAAVPDKVHTAKDNVSDTTAVLLGARSDDTPVKPPAKPAEEATQAGKDEFQAALSSVYANNPQIKAQREVLKATDEGVSQAVSGFRPNAVTEYSQGKQRTNVDQEGWQYQKTKDKTLDVVQPIFSGGATVASYVSAKDRVNAGQAQLTAIEQQVFFSAITAYTTVVASQSVLDVNRNNVDVLTQQLKATQERFKAGELTKTDVAQSQSRLATAQAQERQALGTLESSRATFKRVIGYDPPPVLDMPPIPASLPQNITETIEWAQAAEPSLKAARYLEKAAGSDVNIQTGALLPSINVEGKMTRANDPVPGEYRDNNDSLMVNVVIPLYQSGAEWSRIREAKNQAQQAKFATFDTRDAVTENASRAWQDFTTAQAVIVSNQEAVNAAEVALEGIRQENLYGTRTVLDVLNTEQDLFSFQVSLVNAKITEVQQAYRLVSAVGRLTAHDLRLPVTLEDPKQHYDEVKYKLIGL